MSPTSRLVPPAGALCAALASLAAMPVHAASASSASASPPVSTSASGSASSTQARVHGVVIGPNGVYEHARVCLDRHHDARCGARETAVFTRADGSFSLRGQGALVAEIGAHTLLVDRATGAKTAVARPLVFRAAPAGGAGAHSVGPLSTELQASMDADGQGLVAAASALAGRLGMAGLDPANADALALAAASANGAADAVRPGASEQATQAALRTEQAALLDRIASAVSEAGRQGDLVAALDNRLALDGIRNVVVIYAENRSFNNVFAHFPGADGAAGGSHDGGTTPQGAPQKDRDGSVLPKLPPAWGGLTAAGQGVVVTQAQTTNVLPNAPFQIDSATPAWGAPVVGNGVVTRDLYHRFYENQMQIAGGANDQFAAWGDSGGLVMGWFDGTRTALWQLARQYTLADHFFQGAFGGSFLNHQYLICACAPEFADADTSPAHPTIAALRTDAQGGFTQQLALAPNSPPSALAGPPVFVRSGNITPKNYFGDGTFRAVNTMQPAFQPSYNPPAAGDEHGLYANPLLATTLPAQTEPTIGDMLDARKISWAWYSGGWNAALADRTTSYSDAAGNFQPHHQPFNYYAALDPATHAAERAAHLKDYDDLVAAAAAGTLPAVAFYKPIGTNNEHPGYASLAAGDAHIADLVAKLKAGPQWKHLLIVVTYDENGGQWDALAPPRADLLGPGTRVPAVVISPFARRGYVDHTPYDTGSVLRFVTHRFSLPELRGLQRRDDALVANGLPAMGDLTSALDFRVRQQATH